MGQESEGCTNFIPLLRGPLRETLFCWFHKLSGPAQTKGARYSKRFLVTRFVMRNLPYSMVVIVSLEKVFALLSSQHEHPRFWQSSQIICIAT